VSQFDVAPEALGFFCAQHWKGPRPARNTLLDVIVLGDQMDRWLQRFGAAYTVPDLLEAARAYRKSGDISEREQAELDELEQKLKDSIAKKNDGEG
jgi:hypothetical protein